MKLIFSLGLLLASMLPHDQQKHTPRSSVKIEGVVVSDDNKRPVSQAYLFVVKGEEETISGSNGKFTLTTWQSFPVSLTVEHPSYRKIKLSIKEPGEKQVIRLEPK